MDIDWDELKKKIDANSSDDDSPLDVSPVDSSDSEDSVPTSAAAPLQVDPVDNTGTPIPMVGRLMTRLPTSTPPPDDSQSTDSMDDDSDDDDSDDSDDSDDGSSTPSAGSATPSINPVLAAYLQNKQQMQQAQDQSRQNQMASGLSAALAQIGHGISRAPGTADLSAINEGAKNDDAPVKNLAAQQASGVQAMQSQAALDQNDPNSAASVAARKALLTVAPKLKDIYGDSFDQITAADMPNILKPIDLKSQLDQRAQASQDRSDAMKEKAEAAQGQKQSQAYNQTVMQLEQMRGSPAAAQAEKDIYAAQKANDLIKVAAPNGDLNQMSDAQSKLLQMELSKIASGGQASEAELNAIDPATLTGKLSKVWGQLSNSPTPANAGAFLQQYKNYADGLTKDAQNVITDRYGRIINSRKSEFSDDQYNNLQSYYLDRFKAPAAATGSAPSTSYGQDVLDYAKAHNITPAQAQSVKDQRTGGQ